MEIWKPVVGYEGIYEVSNLGNVRSLDRISFQNHKIKGKVLNQVTDRYGYKCVHLSKSKDVKYVKVHILVAKAFIPNPENKQQVNHKDLIKTNNSADNLEWVTLQENVSHAHSHGCNVGVNNGMYGKKHSKESVEKMSLARKSWWENKHSEVNV